MKRSSVLASLVLLLGMLLPTRSMAGKQCSSAAAQPSPQSQSSKVGNDGALDKVLARMDQTAAGFHTVQADFVWTMFNNVANAVVETDNGKICFRRSGNEIQMAANIEPPYAKQILFNGGKVSVYVPQSHEVQVYDTSAHRDVVEAFLVLGFGSAGSDLKKTFQVTYVGQEKIGNLETDKLELIPTAAGVKQQFPKIDLWIDPEDGISLRQQLFEQDGDYRFADYSNIRLNGKLPGDAFKLKTSGNTKTVSR